MTTSFGAKVASEELERLVRPEIRVEVVETRSCPECNGPYDLPPFLGLVPPEKVTVDEDGCWVYHIADSGNGYGRIGLGALHRLAWEWVAERPVREGYEIHHRCHKRLCFNPWCLEEVTHAENMAYERKRYCKRGHDLDEHGRWRRSGRSRDCSKCKASRKRERGGGGAE